MYPELVYLLDLCTLSYQLHCQTLVWPMDPYGEQMQLVAAKGKPHVRRKHFWKAARAHFMQQQGNCPYRGPAFLAGAQPSGWTDNPRLESVVSDYSKIFPWRPGLVRPDRGKHPGWIVYRTPREITDRIGEAHVVAYSRTDGPLKQAPAFTVMSVHRPFQKAEHDIVYCFEGGTGAVDGGDGASWSPMGFVLARQVANQPQNYDIFIVFRGSRSGTLRIKPGVKGKGNPDWVTDLASKMEVDRSINPHPGPRGFQRCIANTLPAVMRCLELLVTNHQVRPRSIYLTGHSLGGALACHFASAVMLGNLYGPRGRGRAMPQALQAWPWPALQLVTYSAPAIGDRQFVEALGRVVAARRVYHKKDMIPRLGVDYKITLEDSGGIILPGGYDGDHVGTPIELVGYAHSTEEAHDPSFLRRALIDEVRQLYGSGDTPTFTIPAAKVDEVPWTNCPTFAQALVCYTDTKASLADALRGFDVGLGHYFQIFKSILGEEGIPQPKRDRALKDDRDALDAWLRSLPQVTLRPADFMGGVFELAAVTGDEEFKNFLNLCIVLYKLSSHQGAPGPLLASLERGVREHL